MFWHICFAFSDLKDKYSSSSIRAKFLCLYFDYCCVVTSIGTIRFSLCIKILTLETNI